MLSNLTVPLLIIHGERDQLVSQEEVDRLALEPSGPVRIFSYPEGNHGVCNFNAEMTGDMADWLAEALGADGADTAAGESKNTSEEMTAT